MDTSFDTHRAKNATLHAETARCDRLVSRLDAADGLDVPYLGIELLLPPQLHDPGINFKEVRHAPFAIHVCVHLCL